MPVLPKLIYRFKAITSKTPAKFFIAMLIPKVLWKSRGPKIAKNDLEKD